MDLESLRLVSFHFFSFFFCEFVGLFSILVKRTDILFKLNYGSSILDRSPVLLQAEHKGEVSQTLL